MSEYTQKVKCMSCPALTCTAKKPNWQIQIYEARSLLRTCHQIRDEGKQVFFNVNSWTLHRARLRTSSIQSADTMIDDTQRLFERLGQVEAMKYFKHVNMQICLSPLAYCDITVPDSVTLDDPISIQRFELSQHPDVVASHKLDETAQCELFRTALAKLVANSSIVFPSLKTIKLEISLHAKKLVSDAHKNPLDRCGITFYIRIKLGPRNCASPTSLSSVPLPILVLQDVMEDSDWLQTAKQAVRSQKLHPSISGGSCIESQLEPRRHMLSPLRELFGVQCVEVERCWTVKYRRPGVKNVIHEQRLRQLWQFSSVCEMLERAGPEFGGFLDPGLGYLKLSPDDVFEIIENTTEDSGYLHSLGVSVGQAIV